ncbi:MAG: PIN domain-containing protein [Treponema sp.]|nr:PIN domain-containing protein [Treponema sp.]
MNYVLDACALIAFLDDEEGADIIEDLLDKSAAGDVSVYMSIVNLLEVYYAELQAKGSAIAQIVLDMVNNYSIKIVNTISEQIFKEAARLKTTFKMSLGDCIGIATAIELSGQFVTSDHHEINPVAAKETNLILWFR